MSDQKKSSQHRRSSSSRKNITEKRKSRKKDYSIFIGLALVLFGLTMSLYSFDMLRNPASLFDIPDFNNMIQLWPIIIVIIGFIFVFKDYFNRSKTQKWNR